MAKSKPKPGARASRKVPGAREASSASTVAIPIDEGAPRYSLQRAARFIGTGRVADAHSALDRLWPQPEGTLHPERLRWLLSRAPDLALSILEAAPANAIAEPSVVTTLAEACLLLTEAQWRALGALAGLAPDFATQGGHLRSASEALARGDDAAANAHLKALPRGTVFASGQRFLRGLQADYQRRFDDAQTLLGALSDSLGYRAAATALQPGPDGHPPAVLTRRRTTLVGVVRGLSQGSRTSFTEPLRGGGDLTHAEIAMLVRGFISEYVQEGAPAVAVRGLIQRSPPFLSDIVPLRALLARILHEQGEFAVATREMEKFLETVPAEDSMFLGAALEFIAEGYACSARKADELIKAVKKLGPGAGRSYFCSFCDEFHPMGDDPVSERIADLQSELGDAGMSAAETRALVERRQHDLWRKATEAAWGAVAATPQAPTAWQQLVEVLAGSGDRSAHNAALEAFAKACPDSVYAARAAAKACATRGAWDKGLDFALRAAALQPLDRTHRDLQAELLIGKARRRAQNKRNRDVSELLTQACAVPNCTTEGSLSTHADAWGIATATGDLATADAIDRAWRARGVHYWSYLERSERVRRGLLAPRKVSERSDAPIAPPPDREAMRDPPPLSPTELRSILQTLDGPRKHDTEDKRVARDTLRLALSVGLDDTFTESQIRHALWSFTNGEIPLDPTPLLRRGLALNPESPRYEIWLLRERFERKDSEFEPKAALSRLRELNRRLAPIGGSINTLEETLSIYERRRLSDEAQRLVAEIESFLRTKSRRATRPQVQPTLPFLEPSPADPGQRR